MSDQERKAVTINAGAIVTAVVAITGVIFSSGIVVQDVRQSLVILRDIQHKQDVQHAEFLQFKEDMTRRVMILERKAEVLYDMNSMRSKNYVPNP